MQFFLFFFFFANFRYVWSQCPAKEATPNCECSILEGEVEKLRVVCVGVKPGDLSAMFRNFGLLDLTLQNGEFSSFSKNFFSETNIGKLTLINNGIEKISIGDFKGSSPSFREFSISEPNLRLVEDFVFNEISSVQRISLSDSTVLERFPKLKALPNLTFVSFTNNSVRFLEGGTLTELPMLREIDLRSNQIEIFDISSFGELDNVRKLDLTGNSISDLSFLPLVLRNLPNLNFLFLQKNKISKIPFAFLDGLKEILTIDFSKNQINKLPENFSTNSSTLRELYLNENSINEIPEFFLEKNENLRNLNLAKNWLKKVKNEFGKLKNLVYLRLEGNKIQRIDGDALANLSRLESFSLEGNELSVLERGVFGQLENLVFLDISRNFIQEFRGDEIGNLSKLEILLFNQNKLRNVYSGFESLVSLKRLDLSENQISNLDENVFVNLKNLEILQLDGNLLMKFPLTALTKLVNLEKLILSRNRLTRLPLFQPIGHLKYFALDQNSISQISSQTFRNLPEIRQLFLNQNQIKLVEENSFANLLVLYVLDLSENQMEKISPKTFDNLVSLETLNLANNALTRLEDESFGNLPMLRSIDVSQNQIVFVANQSFRHVPNLMQANFSRNFLNSVPESIGQMRKIRRLDLSRNRIRRIESGLFSSLEKLENLNLQRNPLCFLGEKTFAENSNLKFLDLSNTDLRHVPQSAFRSNQDFSNVLFEGVSIDCDCNSKWLRLLMPNLRCGFPGAVMQMKVSQINPEFMICQMEEKDSSVDRCTILPIPTRPNKVAPIAATPPSGFGVTSPSDPDTQVLAKGSLSQAWMTRAEIEAKSQELEASQAAKQIGNAASAQLNGNSFLSRITFFAVLVLLVL